MSTGILERLLESSELRCAANYYLEAVQLLWPQYPIRLLEKPDQQPDVVPKEALDALDKLPALSLPPKAFRAPQVFRLLLSRASALHDGAVRGLDALQRDEAAVSSSTAQEAWSSWLPPQAPTPQAGLQARQGADAAVGRTGPVGSAGWLLRDLEEAAFIRSAVLALGKPRDEQTRLRYSWRWDHLKWDGLGSAIGDGSHSRLGSTSSEAHADERAAAAELWAMKGRAGRSEVEAKLAHQLLEEFEIRKVEDEERQRWHVFPASPEPVVARRMLPFGGAVTLPTRLRQKDSGLVSAQVVVDACI